MPRKPKRNRKVAKKRRRFATPSQTAENLRSISKQQRRYRKSKKQFRRQSGSQKGFAPEIIESIEKSEQAWENELRKITRPEDLNDFE